MKVRLLKRLRRRFELRKRNKEYKVYDCKTRLGDINPETLWLGFNKALDIRRNWILEAAQLYKKHKKIIN